MNHMKIFEDNDYYVVDNFLELELGCGFFLTLEYTNEKYELCIHKDIDEKIDELVLCKSFDDANEALKTLKSLQKFVEDAIKNFEEDIKYLTSNNFNGNTNDLKCLTKR